MLIRNLAEAYDRYFAGSCLLVMRLDGSPNNTPDWITVATAALLVTFFQVIAIGVVTLAVQLEASPTAYKIVSPAFVVLIFLNWIFGTKREEYREYFRASVKDRKNLVLLATSIHAATFLGLVIVGLFRIF